MIRRRLPLLRRLLRQRLRSWRARARSAGQAAPKVYPNDTVEIVDDRPKKVCWTEIVTGTRGRKQTVCRTERTERDAAIMRKDFKDFQNRASSTQPQVPGP